MTGYVMAPTPPEIADHIDKWNKLDEAGVGGLPPCPLEYLTADTGEWIGSFMTKASGWRDFGGQSIQRLGYRLPPLPSLPPSPETVVVVDANTAHRLIGRSIGGEEIEMAWTTAKRFGFCDEDGDEILTALLGESVTLDPLPAPPPEEAVETVRGRLLDTAEALIQTYSPLDFTESRIERVWADFVDAVAALAAEGGE